MITIDREQPKRSHVGEARPKYRAPYKRIETDLRVKIADGIWSRGMLVPSRRELADTYNVSLGTIERAIADLLADGTLVSPGRKGTFVADHAAAEARSSVKVNTSFGSIAVDNEKNAPSTATIGIVCHIQPVVNVNEWVTGWPSVVVSAIERRITSRGMRTRFPFVHPASLTEPLDVIETVNHLLDEGVDGLVFVMLKPDEIDAVTRRFSGEGRALPPSIFVLTQERLMPATSVYYDNRDAGFHAASHLLVQGCRTLTFLSPFDSDFARNRLIGIKEAITRAGLSLDNLTVSMKPCTIESEFNSFDPVKGLRWLDHKISGLKWGREVLASGLKSEGIVAVNDEVAIGFLQAAHEVGLEMSRDFAIVGFDDTPSAKPHNITTMRPPLEAMGEEAARLVLSAITGKRSGQKISLHSELVARQSSHLTRPSLSIIS